MLLYITNKTEQCIKLGTCFRGWVLTPRRPVTALSQVVLWNDQQDFLKYHMTGLACTGEGILVPSCLGLSINKIISDLTW